MAGILPVTIEIAVVYSLVELPITLVCAPIGIYRTIQLAFVVITGLFTYKIISKPEQDTRYVANNQGNTDQQDTNEGATNQGNTGQQDTNEGATNQGNTGQQDTNEGATNQGNNGHWVTRYGATNQGVTSKRESTTIQL